MRIKHEEKSVGEIRKLYPKHSEDVIPENPYQAYFFLNRARSHWLERVKDTGVTDGSAFDTLRILQGAMTSVMIGASGNIY